jgi:hypothetical protein
MARYQIADQLGSFRVGDTPGTITVELVDEEGTPVSLDGVTGATATLDGTTVTATVEADTIEVTLPTLTASGVQYLNLTVTVTGGSAQVDPAPLVVEASDGWHSLASARAEWRDAPDLDVQLYTVLAVAQAQCIEYGPALVDDAGDPTPVPFTWRQAQIMQARNLWNTAKTDPTTGGFGGEGFVIRPYPMDQAIRYILRPRRALGAIA